MLASGLFLSAGAAALGTGKASSKAADQAPSTAPMAIQVNNDRLTLAMTKVPQVYLYGDIDAGAPARFDALVRSQKIPVGSDIYLNSSSGSVAAAVALGRLFRASSMVTHLGTPRRNGRAGSAVKTATCAGACTYAYFGGLYRWAPTGSDRIGLPSPSANAAPAREATLPAAQMHAYLVDMGIDLEQIAPALNASREPMVWLAADQLLLSGLANNAQLPLTVKYQLSAAPTLVLNQVDRHGQHRITLQCKPGAVTLTAYDLVGADHARDIVARGTRSYFEINRQETLTQLRDGASVANDSVMITRSYPPTQLGHLLFARSIGAWVGGRTNAFRYGFTFQLYPVRTILKDYYNACWRAAPWPTGQNP